MRHGTCRYNAIVPCRKLRWFCKRTALCPPSLAVRYSLKAHGACHCLEVGSCCVLSLLQVTHNTTLNGTDSVRHWSWASDLPLECAMHSVGLRCYVDDPHFSGRKEWSDWSPLKNISCKPLLCNACLCHVNEVDLASG